MLKGCLFYNLQNKGLSPSWRPSLLHHRIRIEPQFLAFQCWKVPRKIADTPILVIVLLPLTNPNGIIIASIGSNAAVFALATRLSSSTSWLYVHATCSSVVASATEEHKKHMESKKWAELRIPVSCVRKSPSCTEVTTTSEGGFGNREKAREEKGLN